MEELAKPHPTENRTILGLFNKPRDPHRLISAGLSCTELYHNLGALAYDYVSLCVDELLNDLAQDPRVDQHGLQRMASELRDTNIPSMENALLRFQETVSDLHRMPVAILDSDTPMRDQLIAELTLHDMDVMGENYNSLAEVYAGSAGLDVVLAELDQELEMSERLLKFMDTTASPEEITEEDLKKLVTCYRHCSEINTFIKRPA